MRRILLLLALVTGAAAQSANFQFARMAGRWYASSFAHWTAQVTTPVTVPGVATITVTPARVTLAGGNSMQAVFQGVPTLVVDGSASETVVASAVNCSAAACVVTATFANAHPGAFTLASASDGLDEAIQAARTSGGTVVLGSDWDGTSAQITGAPGIANVGILDERHGHNTEYAWTGSAYAAQSNSQYLADRYCAIAGVLDQSCLAAAVAAIGTAPATILLPAGSYAIGANLTIPANISLDFARGAALDVAVPYTVQIHGPIVAGNWQIFDTALPATAAGSMANGSSELQISGASFTAADIGSAVYVPGASATVNSLNDTDQIIAVGNGTQTTFTASAAFAPVTSLIVWAGNCAGVDNGSGNLSNLFGSSCNVTGTVNHTTGAVSATFSVAPASGYQVKLAFTYLENPPLTGTITAVTSSTTATVSFAAGNTVTAVPGVLFGGSYVKLGAPNGPGQPINPAWWGAVGDGSTDDYAPLQAAFTACGQSLGTVRLPIGIFRTSLPLQAGDPFQTGIYQPSGQQPGQCNIQGVPGSNGAFQQSSVLQAAPGFPAGQFVLTRENMSAVSWRDFEVDGNATGANGIDARWAELGSLSPATSNTYQHISVFNAGKDGQTGTVSFWLDNNNDAVLSGLIAAQERGNAPSSYLIDAGGGPITIDNSRSYGGVFYIAAQNIGLFNVSAYDGLELGGQAWNHTAISGGQIFPNSATGVAINSTSVSSEGTETLVCSVCYLTAGAGQVELAGKWGRSVSFLGGMMVTTGGSPNVFGAISSGLVPLFRFDSTEIVPTLNVPAVGQMIQSGDGTGAGASFSLSGPTSGLSFATPGHSLSAADTSTQTSNGDAPMDNHLAPFLQSHVQEAGSANVPPLFLWGQGMKSGTGAVEGLMSDADALEGWRGPYITQNLLTGDDSEFQISTISQAGGVYTIATTHPANLTVGDTVTLSGIADPSFDTGAGPGCRVTAVTAGSLTCTPSNPSSNGGSSGGTVGRDAQFWGLEVNTFLDSHDVTQPSPVSAVNHPLAHGIVSTSNGTYSPSDAFFSNSSSSANAAYNGFFCSDAKNGCFVAGYPVQGSSALQMAYGFLSRPQGVATAVGNFGSVPEGWTDSVWNGSAYAEHTWTAQVQPGTGTNPVSENWTLNFQGAPAFRLSATGQQLPNNGSAAAPAYSFNSSPGTGCYFNAAGMRCADNGIDFLGSDGLQYLQAAKGTLSLGTQDDTLFSRVAAGVATTPKLQIGGGQTISAVLLSSGTLTFATIAAQSCQDQTVAVGGATATGVASASPSASLGSGNLSWSAWVSAAGVVSVRVCNPTTGAVAPAAVSWNLEVVQ